MKRTDFLKLPMDERRRILAEQADKLAEAGYPFEEWPEVSEPPTIEKMKAELARAGWRIWKDRQHTIWQDPSGNLFRGPYGAWKAMKGMGAGPGYGNYQITGEQNV